MKPLYWYEDGLREQLRSWPEEVRRDFGHQLRDVQNGEFPSAAKWLKGVGDCVVQLKSKGFRTIITVAIDDCIWVVHAFQKDAARGKKTRGRHLDLIRKRIAELKNRYGPVKTVH